MKKLFLFSISFLLISILIGCGCQPKPTEVSLTQTVQEQGLGYTIQYPAGWTYKRNPNDSVVITQTPTSLDPIIQIYIHSSKASGGQFETAKAVIDNFKQTASASNVDFSAEKEYVYTMADGTELKGYQIVVDMKDLGLLMKQVALPSADGNKIYLWSYTSPASNYNKYLDTADAILASWQIIQ